MKLSAQELRIGNLVYNETVKEVMEVYPMMIPQIERCELAGEHNIKPIPLTEEWLLRFVKINWISKDRYGIFYWFNGNKIYIKFVHVLQNTYFCIEQKDLLCRDTAKQDI